MSLIELIGTLFGLACVLLYIRQNIWSWPAGLVQVILFARVFWVARLYSDFLLHLFYIVLQVYGWYRWWRGGAPSHTMPITRLTAAATVGWLAVAAVGTAGIGAAMARWTDAALPYWDASIAVLSVIATFLLARMVLENWLLWIAVDVIAIGVYLAKELYITTGLYAVFLGMAITGFFAWKRNLIQQRAARCEPAADLSLENSSRQPAGISS